MMLTEDSISDTLTVLAVFLCIYFATFIGLSEYIVLPLIMLLGGLSLSFYVRGEVRHDEDMSPEETKRTIYYTLFALAGILLGSFLIPGLFTPPKTQTLAVQDQLLYGALFAVAEERLFRGFLVPYLMWKVSTPMLVHLLSAGIFAVYHLAVYGSSTDALMYVFIAGAMFSVVTVLSRRPTAATVAHVINNFMAHLG